MTEPAGMHVKDVTEPLVAQARATEPPVVRARATEAEADSTARTIGRKAGRGLRWSLLGTAVTKFGSFGVGLVLARLLAPADFGLFAIALAATHFVMHVNDVGLIAAVVQWRGRFEEVARTAATLAVVFSVVIYAGFWFLAPAFATLAGSPQATPLVRLLTAVILIDGITAVRAAALMRRFQQDKLTQANFAGFLVQAGLAVSLAAHGAGPFSFAVGQVGGALVTGILVLTFAKVPLQVGLDRPVAARLLRFGMPLAASLGVEAVLTNADYIIVGRLLGPTALGFYLLAFNMSGWVPGVIGTAVRYVSIAGFSRLAEEDGELAAGVHRTIPLLVGFVLPIAVIMGTFSPVLVEFLYGQQWLPAAGVLQFLAVLMVVRMVGGFAFDILTSAGASHKAFWLTFLWMVPLVPALIVGTRLGGIEGTAIAHAVVALLIAVPLIALSLRSVGVPLAPMGPPLVRPLLGAVATVVACLLLAAFTAFPPLPELLLVGTVGIAVYLGVALNPDQLSRLAGHVLDPLRRRSRSGSAAEKEAA